MFYYTVAFSDLKYNLVIYIYNVVLLNFTPIIIMYFHYINAISITIYFMVIFTDPSQISELLSKTISDAHTRTCLYSLEHIHEMFRKPHDLSRLLYYKNMAHEELWLECAQKLTTIIQQIIEFAKMVPGFMKLSQDDQIVLLKAGK